MKFKVFLALFFVTSVAWATSYDIRAYYPEEAIENCIEGWVLVEYSVTKGGKLADIKIIDAHPEGVFEEAALKRLRSPMGNAEFAEGVEKVSGVQQKLTYELDRGSFSECNDL